MHRHVKCRFPFDLKQQEQFAMASSDKFLHLNQNLYDYVIAHGHNADPILRDLAEETRKLETSRRALSPD